MNLEPRSQRRAAKLWYALLLIPFVALLFPFYLRAAPEIAGFPFFYWYQFLWLLISAGLTAVVYLAVRTEREP